MKVRELKSILELEDEARAGRQLVGISHWVAAIFKARDYVIGNPRDVEQLEKLKRLGIVEIQAEKARLTEQGKELYQDFYKHGYYL